MLESFQIFTDEVSGETGQTTENDRLLHGEYSDAGEAIQQVVHQG